MKGFFLLIHGNSGSAREMDFIRAYLPAGATVFNLDLPMHGANRQCITRQPIEHCAHYLSAALSDHPGPYTVIGYSDGANIAMNLAADASLRIDQLILVSPNLSPQGISKPWFVLFKIIELIGTALAFIPALRLRRHRMRMMTRYQWSKTWPADLGAVQLFFAADDVITKPEQARVSQLTGATATIVADTTHFTIMKSGSVEGAIRACAGTQRGSAGANHPSARAPQGEHNGQSL